MFQPLNILLALLSRALFAAHGVVTVWRVVTIKGNPYYWLLLTGVALLAVEMLVTLKCTRNAEWKWFSPMIFLYLSSVMPSIWFLEVNMLQSKLPVNNSSSTKMLELLDHIPIPAIIMELDADIWLAALEQTMLIVLVLGRWLMPKGDLSRSQLTHLLMVYVGLGADMLDIFESFKEPTIKTNQPVVFMGLALISWALMQFPLVLTQTELPEVEPPRKSAHSMARRPAAPSSSDSCCSREAWSMLITVGFQDGPFLVYRLYIMIREKVVHQLMIFFTCKNILTVLLEFYMIFVVQCEQRAAKLELERSSALRLKAQKEKYKQQYKEKLKEKDEEKAGVAEQSCHADTEKGTRRATQNVNLFDS